VDILPACRPQEQKVLTFRKKQQGKKPIIATKLQK
jgi:hypothetical protein